MKKNIFLIPFVAVITLMIIGFASASLATNVSVELNGEEIGLNDNLASFAGDVVPIKVTFTAGEDADDVKIEVGIYDGRDDVDAETNRFNTIAGKRYTKLLSLKLPSDFDDESDEMTLSVEIHDSDYDTKDYSEDYRVNMQRESYELDVLSVDYSSEVSASEVFPVSVVVKNIGYNRMDDTYVVVSIPTLGISTRGYVGDLDSVENYSNDNHEEDSISKTVYLKVPANSEPGVYELEVKVYNNDVEKVVKQLISVDGSNSAMTLAAVKNQDLSAGETVIYDLIIVNSGDDVKVFNIESVSGDVLTVSAPLLVSVGPDSSETIPISVEANKDAAIGTYAFSVNVDGKQIVFGANVIGTSVSNSVVALTVILIIIFVVLLAVLVVLLTRKEKPIEEVETSYY